LFEKVLYTGSHYHVGAVRQLAQHYKKSLEFICQNELRQYFLYIKNVKKHPRPLTTVAVLDHVCFERTPGKRWTRFELLARARHGN